MQSLQLDNQNALMWNISLNHARILLKFSINDSLNLYNVNSLICFLRSLFMLTCDIQITLKLFQSFRCYSHELKCESQWTVLYEAQVWKKGCHGGQWLQINEVHFDTLSLIETCTQQQCVNPLPLENEVYTASPKVKFL